MDETKVTNGLLAIMLILLIAVSIITFNYLQSSFQKDLQSRAVSAFCG